MKLIKLILVSIIMLVICSSLSYSYFVDTYDISVRVIDDNGSPVENAEVLISFEKNTTSGTRMYAQKGIANAEGRFSASGSGNGHITYGATKQGYYDSHYSYYFASYETQSKDYSLKQDFVILLRKIENPVPMYARRAGIEIPAIGKDVGFDLVEYDWVAPYGKGNVSDFIFNLQKYFVAWNDQDCKLTITFNNRYDGIQLHEYDGSNGSVFKLNRYAPESNYNRIKLLFIKTEKGIWKTNVKKTDNYYFRIRSEEKNDKFYQAMYGKILGHIDFTPIHSKTVKIFFNYYLNPDYTRNLEFDPKRNLFGKLPDLERIIEP